MASQLRILCCVVVWFVAPWAVAADSDAGRDENRKSGQGGPVQTSWNAEVGEYLTFDALGFGLFPVALVVQGERALGLFQASGRPALPPQLFAVQFSRPFVEHYFQHAVESEDVVDDTILGTKIDGQSHLSGVIRILLVPSREEIRFDLVFTGLCRSRTRGVNEVVVLQNTAETQFEAHKEFIWNSNEFTSSPTVALAETRSKTHQIDTQLPGVIGRVATQIAQQRVADVRPQADAIAAEHAAARIEKSLDARVDASLSWAKIVSRHLPVSGLLQRSTRIQVSCNREAAQVVVLGRDTADSASLSTLAPLPNDCDLSIQIHRGTLSALARDPMALLISGVVFGQILETEEPPVSETQVSGTRPAAVSDARAKLWRVNRSRDGQWIVVRHLQPVSLPAPVSLGAKAAAEVR